MRRVAMRLLPSNPYTEQVGVGTVMRVQTAVKAPQYDKGRLVRRRARA